jgi:hypothetical protein
MPGGAASFIFLCSYRRIFCGHAAKNRAFRSNSSGLLRKPCGISAAIPAAWASSNFAKQNCDQPLAPHGLSQVCFRKNARFAQFNFLERR